MKTCQCGTSIKNSASRCWHCEVERRRLSRIPAEDRFWTKVDRAEGACWTWNAARDAAGYGVISRNRVRALAHRLSWEMANGPIPNGLWVLHRCDNPPCVRPDHLFLGTHADNMADMASKDRNARATRKLSDDDVRAIRSAYVPRVVTQKMLANRFGVAQSRVSQLLSSQTFGGVR